MRRSPLNIDKYKEALSMTKYSKLVKYKLTSIIKEMGESPETFVKNPGKDFTRNRKLTFEYV